MTANDGAAKCIFVVGNSRSGTTMMARMLGRHSEVHYLPETHFFGDLWDPDESMEMLGREQAIKITSKLMSRVRDGFYAKHTEGKYSDEAQQIVGDGSVSAWRLFYRFLLYEASRSGVAIPCEQTPRNLQVLDTILDQYSDAKAICMIRDPRDVLLSQRNRWRRRWLGAQNITRLESLRAWANYHPVTTSKIWNTAIDRIEALKADDRCTVVHYEDLVSAPDVVMQSLMQFLGLAYEAQQLDIPKRGSSSTANVDFGSGVRKDRIGVWRDAVNAYTDVQICQQICGERMHRHGYTAEQIRYNPLLRIYKWATLPFQLTIALLLNLSRSRNVVYSLRRYLSLESRASS